MHTDISQYSTKDLLQLNRSEDDRELAYKALWTVFKRWDNGVDTSVLIDFIDTDVIDDKLRGTYFLFEVSPRVDSVKDAVLKLADDALAECRRAFVGYLLNSHWYDDIAAAGLVNCIQDFDLRVRLKVIDWAIRAPDDQIEDFSARLMAATLATVRPQPGRTPWRELIMKRGIRALTIARRVRDGESVAQVKETMPQENGYTFDHLSVFEPNDERRRNGAWRRRENSWKIAYRHGFDER